MGFQSETSWRSEILSGHHFIWTWCYTPVLYFPSVSCLFFLILELSCILSKILFGLCYLRGQIGKSHFFACFIPVKYNQYM